MVVTGDAVSCCACGISEPVTTTFSSCLAFLASSSAVVRGDRRDRWELCEDARCLTPECIDDADCPGGFFCDANVCTSIAGCFDGEARCVDGDTAAVCVDGREVLDECASGFVCDRGDCVDDGQEGEGEEGEGEEGEGEEGEGEGEGEGETTCTETVCLDDVTELQCFFGVPIENACGVDQVCVDGQGCISQECIPQCGARVCGTEPTCGTSCGRCNAGDVCNASGRCVDDGGASSNAAVIEVAVSSTSFDVYLSRATSGSFCDIEESCFFGNCADGDALRPDWDGASTHDGDPVMVSGSPSVLTPATAQSYRVGVHSPRDAEAAASVTVNIAVDGVNVFGATKTLQPGQLWNGIVARWNGAAVTISRTDVVTEDFSCGGETCSQGGDECDTGFSCGFTTVNGTTTGNCVDCFDGDASGCAAGDECRQNRCTDDTTDRGNGGVCVDDVDCRDDLVCGGGTCGVSCDALTCFLSPESCNCVGGTTCGFDGICN